MATPVTIDMSKLTPGASTVAGGGAPPGGPTPVTVDMSKLTKPQGWGDVVNRMGGSTNPAGAFGDEIARGFLKSGGAGVGGVLDLVNWLGTQGQGAFTSSYRAQHPNAGDDEVNDAYQQYQAQKAHTHLADAATWLRTGTETHGFGEGLGAFGEQALEYIGTDGLLGMAGSAARNVGVVAKGVESMEKLKQAQKIAEVLKANPKLAGLVAVGAKAMKEGTMMGAQSLAHTEDPTQAMIAGGLGAGGSLVAGAMSKAGSWLLGKAPTATTIEGVEAPLLKQQVGEKGAIEPTGAAISPKIQKQQQEAAGQMFQNMSQRVAGNILEDVNRATGLTPEQAAQAGVMHGPAMPGETLPGVQQSMQEHPFEFGFKDLEIPEDPNDPAQALRTLQKEMQAPKLTAAQKTSMSARYAALKDQLRAAGVDVSAATKAEGELGGEAMTTKDPHEAIAWREQLQDVMNSPEFGKLSENSQNQIRAQYTTLRDQLNLYHNSPYGPRMADIDIPSRVANIQTPGQAAATINAALEPAYQELDKLTGGRADVLRRQVEEAKAALAKPNITVAAERAATQKMNQANVELDNLIRDNAGSTPITRQYFRAMQQARGDTVFLENLHARLEGMTNGITVENTESGLPRIMTGNTKALESFLSEGNNRNDLVRLFGEQSETNLKNIMNMLSDANTARSTTSVLTNSVNELGRAVKHGAMAGGVIGEGLEGSWGRGARFGGLIGAGIWGTRQLLRLATTSPRIGQMVTYAAQHNLSPQIYAPLIARAVAQTTGLMEPQQ